MHGSGLWYSHLNYKPLCVDKLSCRLRTESTSVDIILRCATYIYRVNMNGSPLFYSEQNNHVI